MKESPSKLLFLSAFFVGLLFALGLGISGMTQVQKVVGFLDVFGDWQPALFFVMGGAISVHALSYVFLKKLARPAIADVFHLPKKSEITAPLVIGSLLFGMGWGLGGFCPGPAIVSLMSFEPRPWIFLGAMLIGMTLGRKKKSA